MIQNHDKYYYFFIIHRGKVLNYSCSPLASDPFRLSKGGKGLLALDLEPGKGRAIEIHLSRLFGRSVSNFSLKLWLQPQ